LVAQPTRHIKRTELTTTKIGELKLVFIMNLKVSPPNAKVSDGSQPPMTFDLSLSESAGSRSLDRLVRQFGEGQKLV
jgi:hypothetical protein